jgi:hypothetical protein
LNTQQSLPESPQSLLPTTPKTPDASLLLLEPKALEPLDLDQECGLAIVSSFSNPQNGQVTELGFVVKGSKFLHLVHLFSSI